MEFETFTRMKEDIRIKSKTSLEKTGNIETEASVLFNRNTTTKSWTHVQNHVQNSVQNHVQNLVQNHVKKCVHSHVQNSVQNHVQNHTRKIKKIASKKTCHFNKLHILRRETYS